MSNLNILMIILDSLRTDYVGIYQNGSSLTPNLDDFARQSVYFQQAISQGTSTPPAIKALMSSTYAGEYDGPSSRLTSTRPVLPTYLRQAGYTTGAIVTNEYLSAARGWKRDFDFYDDCNRGEVYRKASLFRGVNQITKLLGFPLEWPITLPAEILFERAKTWLKQQTSPFFLWVHTMDTHWPYRLQNFSINPTWQIKQHYERTEIRPRLVSDKPHFSPDEHELLLAQYRNAVKYTDDQIGAFLTHLKKEGLLENTAVVILADHGEEFREHGKYFHSAHLYDVLVRVPLIVHLPDSLQPANRFYPNQVRLIDLVPTFLELAHVPAPEYLRGASMLELLKGATEADRPALTETHTGCLYSYRSQGWKLIWDQLRDQTELYHLTTDPHETNNCQDTHPDVAALLKAELSNAVNEIESTRIFEEESSDTPEMIARLRDLGYVD